MPQNQSAKGKNWYESKTIWGVLLASVGFFVSSSIQDEQIKAIQNADLVQLKQYAENIKNSNGNVAVVISQILSAIGAVVAIIGRLNANKSIKK